MASICHWLRKVASFLMIAGVIVAVAQQQAKPSRTISYFTKNDPKHDELLTALGNEPKCTTIDVNVHDGTTNIDAKHETWWLLPSPKEDSGYKKYPYTYMLEPPGTLKPSDEVAVVSDKTARGLAERVCSHVTGTSRGARIHLH